MEIGAIKQTFNNEVILLKKKLNQAKVQLIHKLTRKAKTFTEKKAPDKIKEKFNKKAESAVQEVLIIKKIEAKELARFIITHTEDLNKYLNKPVVDKNKAFARILLHKSMNDKYNYIRERFSKVPIKDLYMSRQERLQLKKEALEAKTNKKKKPRKVSSSEGNWIVENINENEDACNLLNQNKSDNVSEDDGSEDDGTENDGSDVDESEMNGSNSDTASLDASFNESKNSEILDDSLHVDESDSDNSSVSEQEFDNKKDILDKKSNNNKFQNNTKVNKKDTNESNKTHKVKISNNNKKLCLKEQETSSSKIPKELVESLGKGKNVKHSTKNNKILNIINNKSLNKEQLTNEDRIKSLTKTINKIKNPNKNKNLDEKINLRKFKKDSSESTLETKVVDSFFITSTGENYMSVVEPRKPDEIKEAHNQGNRKLRRAVMFGYTPRIKPKPYNAPQNRYDNHNKNNFNNNKNLDHNDKYRQNNSYNKDNNFNNTKEIKLDSKKEEKLHPSWQAKKKMSSILPYEGKKIVFD